MIVATLVNMKEHEGMKHEEKEGRGTWCDMCGKVTYIKPSWKDMRNGN